MRIDLEIQGAQEAASKLRDLRENIPNAVRAAITAGMQLIARAIKDYPPVPPYVGMRKPPLHPYQRTGDYGRGVMGPYVREEEGDIYGYLQLTAPHSLWVRGNGVDYDGAWMHRPFWESISSIFDRLLDQANSIVENNIANLISRLGLD